MALKNYANNPQFKRAAAGTGIVRRNIWAGERALTTLSGGATLDGNVVVDGRFGDTYFQGSVNTNAIYRMYVALSELQSGVTYTASATVKNVGEATVAVYMDWADTVGSGSVVYLQPGQTERISATGARDYTSVYRFADISIATLGGSIHVSERLIEARPSALPFFNGSTVDDTAFAYSWEGGVGSSPSVARAGVVEMRRNLWFNPRPATLNGFGTNNAAELSLVTDFPNVSNAVRSTRTSTNAARVLDMVLGAATPRGDLEITVSGKVRASVAVQSMSIFARPNVAFTTGSMTLGVIDIPAGVSSFSVTGLTFNNLTDVTSGIAFVSGQDRQAVGDTLDFTDLMIEIGPARPYFDGYTTPEADLTPAWTGTPWASESALYGVLPVSPFQSQGNCIGILSYLPTDPTQRAIRVITTGNANGAQINIFVSTPEEQKLWTVLGTVHIPEETTISSRGIGGLQNQGGSYATASWAIPAKGTTKLRRLADTTSWATAGRRIILYPSDNIGESIYLTEVALIPNDYAGPHFDGSSPGATWDGTPNNSASTKEFPALSVYNAETGEERWLESDPDLFYWDADAQEATPLSIEML